jgi:soluble lytic murein transglycosylase-like protein
MIQGRGVWPSTGTGGTLTRTKDGKVVPGRWYLAAPAAPRGAEPSTDQRIQIHVFRQLRNGSTPNINDLAVFLGAKAIQKLLDFDESGQDGIIGPNTDQRIRDKQKDLGVAADGLIGPTTMKAMLMPLIREVGERHGVRWKLLCGKLTWEGNFDPGAVGWADMDDLGLSQINIRAHPHVSVEEAFDPHFALHFGARLMRENLDAFDGNERDAIAAYNLGQGGTRQWIAAGRPDTWHGSWMNAPRNVKAYIDRILAAC